jgi:hypothetical protein
MMDHYIVAISDLRDMLSLWFFKRTVTLKRIRMDFNPSVIPSVAGSLTSTLDEC